jgi:hypothetical protein
VIVLVLSATLIGVIATTDHSEPPERLNPPRILLGDSITDWNRPGVGPNVRVQCPRQHSLAGGTPDDRA